MTAKRARSSNGRYRAVQSAAAAGASAVKYAKKLYKTYTSHTKTKSKKRVRLTGSARAYRGRAIGVGQEGHSSCTVTKKPSKWVKYMLKGGNVSILGPTRIFTDQYDAGFQSSVANKWSSFYLQPTWNQFAGYTLATSGYAGMFDYQFRQYQTDGVFTAANVAMPLAVGQYVYMQSCKTNYIFSNFSNLGVSLRIFDVTCKRDCNYGFVPDSTAGGSKSMRDPLSAWADGVEDTLGGVGTADRDNVNGYPTMSKIFKRYWKIDKCTKIHMDGNSSHTHTVTMSPHRLWDPQFDLHTTSTTAGTLTDINGATYVGGMTHITFCQIMGDPVYQTSTLAQNRGVDKIGIMVESTVKSKAITRVIRKLYASGSSVFGTVTTALHAVNDDILSNQTVTVPT